MHSTDERREVAARLRINAERSWGVDRDALRYAIGLAPFVVDDDTTLDEIDESDSETWGNLADLIDPTCHLVGTTLQTWTDGTRAFYHELSCGHTCETVWAKPPAYCDECGARVVES